MAERPRPITDGDPVGDPLRALALAVLADGMRYQDNRWWHAEDRDLAFWCALGELDMGDYRRRMRELSPPRTVVGNMVWWTDEQMRRAQKALEEAQPLVNIVAEAAKSGKPIAPTKAIGEQAATAKKAVEGALDEIRKSLPTIYDDCSP